MTALSGLGAAAGEVNGARFAAVSRLPTYAAALFVALLVAAGAPADPVDFGLAFDRLEELSTAGALLLAAAILLLAVVLHPLQLPLVRLLEGYWPGRLGQALARAGVRRQERLRRRAAEATAVGDEPTADETSEALAAAWSLGRRFPPDGVELLPTSLGNALRAMEATAGAAYGAETVTWWPRLYGVLGSTTREVVDDRRTQLDVACRLSATAAVLAAGTVPLLARSGWWMALALAPGALAWVAYRAAVAAAVAYGEAVRAAFDLHRFDLLAALHLPLPATPSEERRLNERLSRFWDQGVPLDDLAYQHPDGEAQP